MRHVILLISLCSSVIISYTQPAPFKIVLEPLEIPGLNGIQSFAYGQAGGRWLTIGGRTDGLHTRQPFAAFRPAGKNTSITVVDPANNQYWEKSLSLLSSNLRDQLSSTNMQFFQEGDYLYLVGGYGYSEISGKFITHDKLTAVDVPGIINAIINNTPIQPYFRQVSDTAFAVTGGHLKKIGDRYYLVGGQKFLGRYNPMGPDHGPGFIQQYTNQVRKFKITDDGLHIGISDYETITDGLAFHRRDFNVVPQILTGEEEALAVFSGVFQENADIPFLNSVTIRANAYVTDQRFAQYFNHYHCAVMAAFSQNSNEMHNVFFGGIAQYYNMGGTLVQNDEIPFVKTISRVTRDKAGTLTEYQLPDEMPALLGAGSEFILLPEIPHYSNKTIKLDDIKTDTTLVGHIYGGIISSLPNIFFINTGEESSANSELYRVYVIKNILGDSDQMNRQSINGLQLQVFPDAVEKTLLINFMMQESTTVELIISDVNGVILTKQMLRNLEQGPHTITRYITALKSGEKFWVTLKTPVSISTQLVETE